MRYMLDTNILIYLLKNKPKSVVDKVNSLLGDALLCVSKPDATNPTRRDKGTSFTKLITGAGLPMQALQGRTPEPLIRLMGRLCS